jgi:hypothetical protein
VAGAVTVKETGLLLFMLGATDTTNDPDVAAEGIVMAMELVLQLLTVVGDPFSVTVLLPCEAPNAEPSISTWVPMGPSVGEMLLMNGEGLAAVLTETLSKVAVAKVDVLPVYTPSPMYTFCPMLMVSVVPTGAQFTPSAEM